MENIICNTANTQHLATCNTANCNTAKCNTAKCSTATCNAGQFNAARFSLAICNTVTYNNTAKCHGVACCCVACCCAACCRLAFCCANNATRQFASWPKLQGCKLQHSKQRDELSLTSRSHSLVLAFCVCPFNVSFACGWKLICILHFSSPRDSARLSHRSAGTPITA